MPAEDIGNLWDDADYSEALLGEQGSQMLELSKMTMIDGFTDHIINQLLKYPLAAYVDEPITDEECKKVFGEK